MSNPNVGMIYPVFAPLVSHTDGSMPTYGTGRVLQEARNATVTKTVADNPLYGDDRVVDNDNETTAVSISFESTGLNDEDRVAVLGDQLRTDGEYWENAGATPKGGFAYIRRMREVKNGVTSRNFEAWLTLCIQFQEATQSTATREGQINWGTPTLAGSAESMYIDDSGEQRFRLHKTFPTAAAAKAWINGLLNVPAAVTT